MLCLFVTHCSEKIAGEICIVEKHVIYTETYVWYNHGQFYYMLILVYTVLTETLVADVHRYVIRFTFKKFSMLMI